MNLHTKHEVIKHVLGLFVRIAARYCEARVELQGASSTAKMAATDEFEPKGAGGPSVAAEPKRCPNRAALRPDHDSFIVDIIRRERIGVVTKAAMVTSSKRTNGTLVDDARLID